MWALMPLGDEIRNVRSALEWAHAVSCPKQTDLSHFLLQNLDNAHDIQPQTWHLVRTSQRDIPQTRKLSYPPTGSPRRDCTMAIGSTVGVTCHRSKSIRAVTRCRRFTWRLNRQRFRRSLSKVCSRLFGERVEPWCRRTAKGTVIRTGGRHD